MQGIGDGSGVVAMVGMTAWVGIAVIAAIARIIGMTIVAIAVAGVECRYGSDAVMTMMAVVAEIGMTMTTILKVMMGRIEAGSGSGYEEGSRGKGV